MAKEKYIFVFEVDTNEDLKDALPDCNSCTCWPCDEHCIGRKRGISRQEVIKRMAKAMCRRDYRISCDKCIYKNTKNCKTILENWFIEDAEVALNAIVSIIPQEEE